MTSYERLADLDALFLQIEDTGSHIHAAGVLIFEAASLAGEDGGLDIARIRSYVESRLHKVPRYRQKLARTPIQRHPIWIDGWRTCTTWPRRRIWSSKNSGRWGSRPRPAGGSSGHVGSSTWNSEEQGRPALL